MKLICECGYIALPEAFHLKEFEHNNEGTPMKMYYFICPQCENEEFAGHFPVDVLAYSQSNLVRVSMAHIYDGLCTKEEKE